MEDDQEMLFINENQGKEDLESDLYSINKKKQMDNDKPNIESLNYDTVKK